MTTKKCRTCKIELEINTTNFRKKYLKKDGSIVYRFECRKCENKRAKNWRLEKPEVAREQKKKYLEKTRDSHTHIASRLVQHSKKRAKENNLEHTLEAKDLFLPERCPVLNLKLQSNAGGIALANSFSLDRLDNLKGYTKENVRVISYRANSLKNDGTFLEHIKVARYINTNKNFLSKFIDACKAFCILTGIIN